MEIKVYATLRDLVGAKSVQVNDAPEMTAKQMLEAMFEKHPVLRGELLNGDGDLQTAFHVFINGRDVRYINGLDTKITTADEVRIFPPVGGGVT